MPSCLGKTLIIANPAAQNGNGAAAAEKAGRLLKASLGEDELAHVVTEGARHAEEIAAQARDLTSVIALGGDGIVHEVANGLMRLPAETRPALGLIPVGSGNDYARTIGMTCDVDRACAQLLASVPRPADIGRVNGRYFVETLSFGLDAAIALDTVERRKRTGRTGTILYVEAGINQLLHHLTVGRYTASFDGGPAITGESVTFAVQIGPTYGSGFVICPEARIDDGLFDMCIAHPPVSIQRAILIFALAKSGRHTVFKQMEFLRAHTLHVEFDEAHPAQTDGEPLEGRIFDIQVESNALNVLMPASLPS